MSGCGCQVDKPNSGVERHAMRWALALNATMFVSGGAAGLLANSSGVIADALDMLADASSYWIALVAIGRPLIFKHRAAWVSGLILATLGAGVVADVGRRALLGSEPEGWIMLPIATLSLIVNLIVLRLLRPFRKGEIHLRATWIFTRADVIANVGVISAALLVIATGMRWPDLAIGFAIGLYVIKEALEILRDAYANRHPISA